MFNRTILHCDINSCYASIEQARYPELKGKPVAVCGSEKDRNGIILAKSLEAKKMGVKTGQVIWQAKKACPDLIQIPADFSCYLQFSKMAHMIYLDYSPRVEPFGIDECWIDISGSVRLLGNADKIAKELRSRFKDELGISISVGISNNKIFAKLASDYKKPDCQTRIDEKNYKDIAWPLRVSDLLFCGPKTTKKLSRYGILTIGDLALSDPIFIKKLLGINGLKLYEAANGRDCAKVAYYKYKPPIKSIGCGTTFRYDLKGYEEIFTSILRICEELEKKLNEKNFMALSLNLSIRYPDLSYKNMSKNLEYPCSNASELGMTTFKIFKKLESDEYPIRAMTIRAEKLISKNEVSQDCFLPTYINHKKKEQLGYTMVDLRRKYGPLSCRFANIYHYDAANFDNNCVTMPINNFVSLNDDKKNLALLV